MESPASSEGTYHTKTFDLGPVYQRFFAQDYHNDSPKDIAPLQAIMRGQTFTETEQTFAKSEEFKNRIKETAKQSPEDAIDILYKAVMRRDPDSVGVSIYTNQLLEGKSTNDIIEELLMSDEYRNTTINQLYQEVFEQDADPDGQRIYTEQLRNGKPLTDIATELKESDKYKRMPNKNLEKIVLFGRKIAEVLRDRERQEDTKQLPTQPDLSEKQESTKEELLMEELLQKGRSEINQEIFRDHTENIAETGKPHLPLPQIQPGFGVALSWEALDILPPSHSDDRVGELTRRGIYETVAFIPLTTNITEAKTRTNTRSVQVTKKPFLGIFGKEKTEWKQEPYEKTYNAVIGQHPTTTTEAGGIESDEQAVSFLYYASARGAANSTVRRGFRPMGDDRPGSDFTMKMVLPESVARELSSYIKDNPLFARKVVDRFIRERYDEEAIKRYEYQMVRGQKLFDDNNGKMYMLDLLDIPTDQVNQHHPFDSNNVLEIPKK